MNRLTIDLRVAGVANRLVHTSTSDAESATLGLTSNFGYSDVYSDIYAGPSSATLGDADIVLVVPPSTNTQSLRLSASSSDLGVTLSSQGPSVFKTSSTVLYLGTTGSDPIPNVKVLML